MGLMAAAPTISPRIEQLVREVTSKLDQANFLLAVVGIIAALVGILLAAAAVAGVAAAKSYVEKWAEAVAERQHSVPIARVLDSVAFLEWAQIKGVGPRQSDVFFLAHNALELLQLVDNPDPETLDLLTNIKSNLAYYYVDFDKRDRWETALDYSEEAVARFASLQGEEKRRRGLEWLETYAFVHSRLLTCDKIRSSGLRQTLEQWMNWYEPIRERLERHLAFINERCPEQQTLGHR